METSEKHGGQAPRETLSRVAADGAGHFTPETQKQGVRPDLTPEEETPGDGAGHSPNDAQGKGARPEEIGDGHQGADDQNASAVADGDERARDYLEPTGQVPAVADPIESEIGGGHVSCDNQSEPVITNGGGHAIDDTHVVFAPADPTSSGHTAPDTQAARAAAGGEGGQSCPETQACRAPLIAELIAQHRQREGLHRAEKSLTLQIKANCRWLCEGDKAAAKVLYDATMKKKPDPHPLGELFWGANLPFINARNQIEPERLRIEARMEEIAAQFPVVEWWCSESGRNLLGLAQIIGETGDLWNYANPGKLWARLCVDVYDGKAKRRQRGVDNAYNAPRRSVSWRIADSLFKGQSERVDKETGEVKREAGPYRLLYDERKAREIEKVAEEGLKVAPSAKIPKAKASEYRSEGHIHKRALRYMEKRLLKHLWQIWRGSREPSALSFEVGGECEG